VVRLFRSAVLAGLFGFVASTAYADVNVGMSLFSEGKVDLAAAEWTQDAENGNGLAAYLLGSLYQTGNGVEVSDISAIKYLTQASEDGIADAQIALAFIYFRGSEEAELDPSPEQGLNWLDKAAVEHFHPAAQYHLGLIHRSGYGGVVKSGAEGNRWLLLSAKKRYVPALIELGYIYANGDRVIEDPYKGAMYLELAREFGADGPQDMITKASSDLKFKVKSEHMGEGKVRAQAWKKSHPER